MKEVFSNFISSRNDEYITIKNCLFVTLITEKCARFCSINKYEVTIKKANLNLFFATLIGEPITDRIQNSVLNVLSDNFRLEDVAIIEQSQKSQTFLADFYRLPSTLFKQVCEKHLSDLKDSEFNNGLTKFYYAFPDAEMGCLSLLSDEINPEKIEGPVSGFLMSATKEVAKLNLLTKPIMFHCIGCLIKDPSIRYTKVKEMLEFEIFIPFTETWIKANINMKDVVDFNRWIQVFESKANYRLEKPSRYLVPYCNEIIGKIIAEAKKNSYESPDSTEFRVKAAFETFAQEKRDQIILTNSEKVAAQDKSGKTIYIEGEYAHLTYKGIIKEILALIKPINRSELAMILNVNNDRKKRQTTDNQHMVWIVKKVHVENLFTYQRHIGIDSGIPPTTTTDEVDAA